MKKTLLFLIAATAITVACSKKESDHTPLPGTADSAHPVTADGYGPSNKPFSGTSWTLPTGVKLEDSIHDYSYCWAFSANKSVPEKDWRGVPLGFPFCFTLTNTTAHPIRIVFPPELVFVSSSVLHQNTLVINLGTLEIPAGMTQTIVAEAFCLNKGRTPPQTYAENTEQFLSYSFGPSNIPSALKEVTDIVEAKNISVKDVLKADGTIDNDKTIKYYIIQTAIWEVTDDQGLTAKTRKALKDL